MRRIVCTLLAALTMLGAPAVAPGQIVSPISPYPRCAANKAATSACMCGVQPAAICLTGSWCTFTPEGVPQCSRSRPLH